METNAYKKRLNFRRRGKNGNQGRRVVCGPKECTDVAFVIEIHKAEVVVHIHHRGQRFFVDCEGVTVRFFFRNCHIGLGDFKTKNRSDTG